MSFNFDVVNDIGTLSESKKNNWGLYLMEISWNGREPKKEIRKMDKIENVIGKGIGLTDEELENLTNILVSQGYGSSDVLKKRTDKEINLFDYEGDVYGNDDKGLKIKF